MKSFSVHDALHYRDRINGHCVEVEGILVYEFEDVSIRHWPTAEQTSELADGVWIDVEGVFALNDEVLRRWAGKRVVVLGVFETAPANKYDGGANGFGHFGLWPARVTARRIDLLKKRLKEHPEQQR